MGHLFIIFGIWNIELQVLEHVKCFGFVDGRWGQGGGGGEGREQCPADNISLTIIIISPAGITSRQIKGGGGPGAMPPRQNFLYNSYNQYSRYY